MAVKKRELVQDNCQLDLKALAQYIQMMNDQPNYLPQALDLIKNCQDIVKCLTLATGNEWNLLQSIEEFFLRVVNHVHCTLRHEIVTAVLDKLYSFISDPKSHIGPQTSVVLVVLDGLDDAATMSNARWLVQQGESGPDGAGLRAALSVLYCWMHSWQGTPLLGDWVMAYIKALEENEKFEILLDVSLENLEKLFLALGEPGTLRTSEADVVIHILASLREQQEALDKIATNVRKVLGNLAADSRQSSRQHLQNVVDIVNAMVDYKMEPLKGEPLETFKDKYEDLISCLEYHMASRWSRFKHLPPWRPRGLPASPPNSKQAPARKVGLLNLGNTCYMNSVMQALLVTRHFSTHVMMKMNAVPYWSKMGILFAKMMHSYNTKLNPDEFFNVVKPPFFTVNNQHDSSEFLGYLFVLLQSYEHCSDVNFDYSRQAVMTAGTRQTRSSHASQASHAAQPTQGAGDDAGSSNRGSLSPRPSSSVSRPGGSSSRAGGSGARAGSSHSRPSSSSGSGNSKATSLDVDSMMPPKKRMRHLFDTTFLRRDSIIDTMFGGVLLTRVECTDCHSSSLSRDVFRDLQLAFPDKPEASQHSVQSLLEYYCSKESLSGDNKYQCRDCGGLRDAERSVLIETSPKYLILVLKNFKFEPKIQVQTKLMHSMYHNQSVTLPTVRARGQHSAYSLYAAIIHAGTTLDSGHYYTLAKDNDQWHIYNDDIVTNADESEFSKLHPNSTPYILFYRRSDMEESSAPTLEELPPKLQECVMAHNKHYMEKVRAIHLSRP